MPLEYLDADKIVATIETLHRRIVERFPNAGLAGVCRKVHEIARAAKETSAKIARPNLGIRALSALVIATILAATAWIAWIVLHVDPTSEILRSTDLIQVLEAGLNAVLLIGATVFFFVTLEVRIKRRRALRAIHSLRSVAHIIDMHQLTKDPERLLYGGPSTKSSPSRTMTQFELSRYLDYCSELLSLTGKVAALYVQTFEDSVVVSAVNDIENLTTDLSRQIWQKLMVLHSGEPVALPPAQEAAETLKAEG